MRALILLLLLACTPWALASPLSGPAGPQETTEQAGSAGPWERTMQWVLAKQRQLHRDLARGMEAVERAPTLANTLALILIGFLYGVFHAAGPGHGKAVITTYLLTHRQHMRRGLILSWASSLLQGFTAIALVLGVVVVAERMAREALGQVRTLELVSFALVAAVGAWLIMRALRGLYRLRTPGHSAAHVHEHHADHDHDAHACGTCGHAHHVTPEQAARSNSLGTMVGTVVAVGIRPCTGAILVLAVANMLGLWMAGVAAVVAMSVGTAITVSVLAILAVKARDWAGRATAVGGSSLAWQRTGQVVALMGGVLIFAIGASLFGAGLGAPVHPLGL
ncbi:high frequency lysogenization protein HflD [Thioalkalivibrio denitrificans]|uniref:Nickel/cobalt efflux system n=1 Tax=Thioalkalivibrio denitrificans TaxID=108003 RepID=A0A1V3NL51_9GAMM|nr:nickel/cobalt transporter [Thioalkalivibrio denitrificans]OOG25572.1 high frequency lysogenization protein HflD [Thioalkalivibrio denitrificans]